MSAVLRGLTIKLTPVLSYAQVNIIVKLGKVGNYIVYGFGGEVQRARFLKRVR